MKYRISITVNEKATDYQVQNLLDHIKIIPYNAELSVIDHTLGQLRFIIADADSREDVIDLYVLLETGYPDVFDKFTIMKK